MSDFATTLARLAKRRVNAVGQPWASRWSFGTSPPMVSFFAFSAPLLVVQNLPGDVRSGQSQRRGRSNSSSTRQTVSVLPIRPSPPTEGSHPLPAVRTPISARKVPRPLSLIAIGCFTRLASHPAKSAIDATRLRRAVPGCQSDHPRPAKPNEGPHQMASAKERGRRVGLRVTGKALSCEQSKAGGWQAI